MTLYELIVGLIILLLSLMLDNKSLALPVFFTSFFLLEPFYELLTQLSLSFNLMFIVFILELNEKQEKNALNDIILKNKRIFPFSDNIVVGFSKSPYVFLYLKEGKVIRIRCSLKELISTQPYLKKINRNTAISPNVKLSGENCFTYNDEYITLDMILTWGNNSNKKDDS